MFEKLKNYYNKTNIDFCKDDIHFQEFHALFHFLLQLNRIEVDNEKKPRWSFAWAVCSISCSTFAVFLTATAFGHYVVVKDLALMTEMGVYTVIVGLLVMWLVGSACNQAHYSEFQKIIKADFEFVCGEGRRCRDQFLENHLKIWKASLVSAGMIPFIGIVMWSVATIALVRYFVVHTRGDGMRRPLIFPFWLPNYNVYDTPFYEVFFVTSYVFVVGLGVSLFSFLYILVIWIGTIMAKADIVLSGIKCLLDDLREPRNEQELYQTRVVLRKRMKQIVDQHCSMYMLLFHFKSVYGKLLMYQQIATVPAVCLTAYVFAERLDKGQLDLIMLVLCLGASIQVFIPSYACTTLSIKMSLVIDACQNVNWWTIGRGSRVIRLDLQLVMMRALEIPKLRSPGFKEISLLTFSSMMASAYSYFNMLRQINV